MSLNRNIHQNLKFLYLVFVFVSKSFPSLYSVYFRESGPFSQDHLTSVSPPKSQHVSNVKAQYIHILLPLRFLSS